MLSFTFNCKVEVGVGKQIQKEKQLLIISDIVSDMVRKWSLFSLALTREMKTVGMQYACIEPLVLDKLNFLWCYSLTWYELSFFCGTKKGFFSSGCSSQDCFILEERSFSQVERGTQPLSEMCGRRER